MIRHWLLGLKVTSRQPRRGSRVRAVAGPGCWRDWRVECSFRAIPRPTANRSPSVMSNSHHPSLLSPWSSGVPPAPLSSRPPPTVCVFSPPAGIPTCPGWISVKSKFFSICPRR